MKASFHNTIEAQGQMLMKFEVSAKSDEALILECFHRTNKPMAWFEVMAALDCNMNECSLKRGLSNLSTDKLHPVTKVVLKHRSLNKTKEQAMGPHGKPCCRYSLFKPQTHGYEISDLDL